MMLNTKHCKLKGISEVVCYVGGTELTVVDMVFKKMSFCKGEKTAESGTNQEFIVKLFMWVFVSG